MDIIKYLQLNNMHIKVILMKKDMNVKLLVLDNLHLEAHFC